MIKGLEVGLSQLGITDDYFLQVSGILFKYNPNNPVGGRIIISSVRINCQPFNPAKKYTLTVNEGLYGILLMMGIQVKNVVPTGIPEYIALKDFITLLGKVKYASEGRIKQKSNNFEKDINESFENPDKMKEYKLYNNFPNPFNPVTTIKFQIPKDENVTLKIFNSLGQEIERIANGFMKAGTYSFTWNGSKYSSGVYFYRLQAENYINTMKMLLIK